MQILLKQNHFKSFFDAPFRAYGKRSSVPFISQMDLELKALFGNENPVIKHGKMDLTYWSAIDTETNQPIGRILAHVHRPSQVHFPEPTGFFGYFDCNENPEAARLLIEAAENWLRAKGMKKIIGAFNLMATQMMGVMTEGFEKEPYVAQNYNGPAVQVHLKANGYEPHFKMTTYECILSEVNRDYLKEVIGHTAPGHENYQWRPLAKKEFKKQLQDIRLVLNDSFEKNPYFCPMTWEEFYAQSKDLSHVMDPDISFMVYNEKNEMIGSVLALPDLNQIYKKTNSKFGIRLLWNLFKKNNTQRRAALLFIGVNKSEHASGLGAKLTARILDRLIEKNYASLGVTWISETNKGSTGLIKRFGAKPHHHLSLFQKDL